METYNLFCNSEFVLLKLKKELDIASGENYICKMFFMCNCNLKFLSKFFSVKSVQSLITLNSRSRRLL